MDELRAWAAGGPSVTERIETDTRLSETEYTSPNDYDYECDEEDESPVSKNIFYTGVGKYEEKAKTIEELHNIPLADRQTPPLNVLIEVDEEDWEEEAVAHVRVAPGAPELPVVTSLPDPDLLDMLLTPESAKTFPTGQDPDMLSMLMSASNKIYETADVLNKAPLITAPLPEEWDPVVRAALAPRKGLMTPERATEIFTAVNQLSTDEWDQAKELIELIPEVAEEPMTWSRARLSLRSSARPRMPITRMRGEQHRK
jgi:hypothetical protein